MLGLILLIGLFGVPVGLIWLIVALFKKKPKKTPLIVLAISFALFFVGIAALPGASESDTFTSSQAPAQESTEPETEAQPATEEQPAVEEATESQAEEETEAVEPEETDTAKTEAAQEEAPASIIAEPKTYSGSGDNVVTLESFADPWILYISGNAAESNFIVTGYTSGGEYVDLLVNTTEQYSGIVMDPEQKTEVLEIKAEGDWTVEQRSLYSADTIGAGETYHGNGDSVLLVTSAGGTATFEGNSAGDNFIVWAYGASDTDLLVNTTEQYSGTVMLEFKPIIITVKAVGDWSATF